MSSAKEVSGSSVFVNECKKRRESIYYYTIVEFLADEETPANLWLMYEKVLVFSCLLMCAKQLFFVVYYTTSVVKTPLRWSWALHAKCSSFLTTLCLDWVSEATKICRKKVFCNATSAFYVISHGWKFNGKSFCSSSGAFSYLLLLENLPLIAVRSKRCDVDIICIPKIEVSKNTHCWKITQNVLFQFL